MSDRVQWSLTRTFLVYTSLKPRSKVNLISYIRCCPAETLCRELFPSMWQHAVAMTPLPGNSSSQTGKSASTSCNNMCKHVLEHLERWFMFFVNTNVMTEPLAGSQPGGTEYFTLTQSPWFAVDPTTRSVTNLWSLSSYVLGKDCHDSQKSRW